MKSKYLLAIFATLLLIVGCSKDDLDQNPSDSYSDETVLNSKETVYGVLMGAYSKTEHFWYLTIGQISLDVMGQDLTISDGTHGFSTYNWLMFAYNYVQYPKVVDGWWSAYSPYMWRRAYEAIDQCNEIISNADVLPDGCESILAQAYGLRGYNFLNLYHLYCGAYTAQGADGQGLFLRLTPGSADGNDVDRSDLGTSFAQIISDLEYAYENSTETSNYYITSQAAALLLARTYLEMGDYDNARTYVEELSSFDGSDLMSVEEYQSGFNTANSEWLWGLNFNSETTNIYASIPSFYHCADAKDSESGFGTSGYGTQTTYEYLEANAVDFMVGYSTVRASSSFVSIFGDNDCRALFPFYISLDDGYFIAKYSSKESLGIADYPVCRLAEAYLIEAECLLNSGETAQALEVLNVLQSKRNGTLSTEASIDEIWKERRRELYGEGFALTDIKRLRLPLTRTGSDQWSSVTYLPADSPRMMFPIPGDELEYNTVADEDDQNEYWR